jgi:AcrR family transcriptional regulator
LVKESAGARERLLEAAYTLFAQKGVQQTGIDAILAKAGCAKASLYGNFGSKTALALAFLDRREEIWTRGWLEAQIKRRSTDPKERLLAIFDVFDGWFRKPLFEGCSFINVLLESPPRGKVHQAAALHLAKIRAILVGFAEEAGLEAPETFAQAWHMLMKGSIVAAGEGNKNAAKEAKLAAGIILDNWAQRKPPHRERGRRRGS